ncbi:MAG TPA: DUF5676 family membrane protein [Candidatus Thermoplasmatota archaeon]|nr:DUF5676 family membrane protein [Candidatus Thermoplasmatota archaeon]
MHLQVQKFAASVAALFGGVYFLCAAVVVVAPAFATASFGMLFHLLNVETLMFGLTAGAVLGGLVQVTLYSDVIAWAVGALAVHFLAQQARPAGR